MYNNANSSLTCWAFCGIWLGIWEAQSYLQVGFGVVININRSKITVASSFIMNIYCGLKAAEESGCQNLSFINICLKWQGRGVKTKLLFPLRMSQQHASNNSSACESLQRVRKTASNWKCKSTCRRGPGGGRAQLPWAPSWSVSGHSDPNSGKPGWHDLHGGH